jgi:hypothetical protein
VNSRHQTEMKRSSQSDDSDARVFDKLACVSRVMFDQRVLDLRKENEELQAKVAQYEYGHKMLLEQLVYANSGREGCVCHCSACFVSKRFDTDDGLDKFPKSCLFNNTRVTADMEEKECLVKKCLVLHAENLGFEVAKLNMPYHSDVPDTCHIILWTRPDNFYWTVEYGQGLKSKDFHKNPLLDKLKELFKIIDDKEFFTDPETGEDYDP